MLTKEDAFDIIEKLASDININYVMKRDREVIGVSMPQAFGGEVFTGDTLLEALESLKSALESLDSDKAV